MVKGYNVEVRLLAITGLAAEANIKKTTKNQCEEIIEYSGRLCWDTIEKAGTKTDRIQEWVNMGHESVIEHASATFYIRASRVLTHELVRHRLASYSQRSQRYVNESTKKYIVPAEITFKGKRIFTEAMNNAWYAYNELLKLGENKELARYVLPNACETQIIMTMNFRELRHFIKVRTSEKALPEMRAVANEVKKIMKKKAPKVFFDL
jgi:thymidylate synthase (FAD)